MTPFNLKDHELTVAEVHRNFPPSSLYEHAIRYEKDASIAENGALVAYSGAKTGRSPKDKRVVRHPDSEKDIWWGKVNIPLDARTLRDQPRTRASTTSTPATGFTASTALPAGTRSIASKVRVICARALSRAVHAHHADPPDARQLAIVRQAGLRRSTTPASSRPTA